MYEHIDIVETCHCASVVTSNSWQNLALCVRQVPDTAMEGTLMPQLFLLLVVLHYFLIISLQKRRTQWYDRMYKFGAL